MGERGVWLALAGLVGAASGCAGDLDAGGAEARAWVLFDEDALRAGHELELEDWRGAARLPVAAPAPGIAVLHDPRGRTRDVELAPGELLWLRGAAAEPEALVIGRDLRADRLVVRGEPAAIALLAEFLGAEVDGDGVRAEALLDRLDGVDAPAGVVEVIPDFAVDGDLDVPGAGLGGTVLVLGTGAAAADRVGVYSDGKGRLILDAAGGFTLVAGCDQLDGTYRVDDGGHVELIARGGSQITLAIDGDRLTGPGGVFVAAGTDEEDLDEAP